VTRLEKVLLAVGLAAFVFLAARMDWTAVSWAVRSVGFGILFILALEAVAHVFNALGWWACFLPEHRMLVPSLWRLLRLRIAGDGVHYIIPSAIVAGEMAKASMIGGKHPLADRLSSLVVSKFTQLLAFALISAGSLLLILRGRLDLARFEGHRTAALAFLGLLAASLLALVLRAWTSRGAELDKPRKGGVAGTVAAVDQDVREFLSRHPGLFCLSVAAFAFAYLWGAVEAYYIASFLGVPVSAATALIIEMLSITVDGVFFMVPAKAGTQEVTKTAIFTALGLPKAAGFAFGLVRHAREIFWSVAGWGLFYMERRGPAPAASDAPLKEPVGS